LFRNASSMVLASHRLFFFIFCPKQGFFSKKMEFSLEEKCPWKGKILCYSFLSNQISTENGFDNNNDNEIVFQMRTGKISQGKMNTKKKIILWR
jgi:hypothetical protein